MKILAGKKITKTRGKTVINGERRKRVDVGGSWDVFLQILWDKGRLWWYRLLENTWSWWSIRELCWGRWERRNCWLRWWERGGWKLVYWCFCDRKQLLANSSEHKCLWERGCTCLSIACSTADCWYSCSLSWASPSPRSWSRSGTIITSLRS